MLRHNDRFGRSEHAALWRILRVGDYCRANGHQASNAARRSTAVLGAEPEPLRKR